MVDKVKPSDAVPDWLDRKSEPSAQRVATFEAALSAQQGLPKSAFSFPLDVLARPLKPLPTPNTFIGQSSSSGSVGADILQVLPWARIANGGRPGESAASLAGRLSQMTGVNVTVARNLPELLDQIGPGGFGPAGAGPSLTPAVFVTRRDDGGTSIQNFYRPFAMQDQELGKPGQPQAVASAGLQLLGPGMSVYITAHPDGVVASLKTASTISRQSSADGESGRLSFSQEGSSPGGRGLHISGSGGAAIRLSPRMTDQLLTFLGQAG